jgi:colicin import membrane protein
VTEPEPTGALASIRKLEQALAESSTARTAAEEQLEAARAEAASLLAAARRDAAEASDAHRREALARADRETAEIARRAEASAAKVRAGYAAAMDETVEAALALILPAGAEGEA